MDCKLRDKALAALAARSPEALACLLVISDDVDMLPVFTHAHANGVPVLTISDNVLMRQEAVGACRWKDIGAWEVQSEPPADAAGASANVAVNAAPRWSLETVRRRMGGAIDR